MFWLRTEPKIESPYHLLNGGIFLRKSLYDTLCLASCKAGRKFVVKGNWTLILTTFCHVMEVSRNFMLFQNILYSST